MLIKKNMKVYIHSLIDTDDLNLSREEKKALILDIDLGVAEVNFTLEICKSLVDSLIKNGESNKEEIIQYLFGKNETKT